MRRRRHALRLAPALVAVVGSGLVAACDTNDGRDMKDPDPYQEFQLQNTTPTTTSTTTTIAPEMTASTSTSTSTSTAIAPTVEESVDDSTADSGAVTDSAQVDSGSEAPVSTVDPLLSADTLAESLGLADL